MNNELFLAAPSAMQGPKGLKDCVPDRWMIAMRPQGTTLQTLWRLSLHWLISSDILIMALIVLSMLCELLDILLSSSFFPSFPFQVHPHRRWSHVQRRTMAKLLNIRSKNLTGDMSPSYVVYMDIKIFYYSDYKTVLGYNFTFA